MVDSSDFAQVQSEADDIAQSVSQKLTSAHVLLALFTVENRAALLLKERGIDEDRLLGVMQSAPLEADPVLRELLERTREIARQCGSPEADCLHLLIAVTRVRCAAQELLQAVRLDLTSLRNTALSYYLSGRMPRKLQLGRPGQEPSGRPVAPRPTAQRPQSAVAVQPQRAPLPLPASRALIDEPDETPLPEVPPLPRPPLRLVQEPVRPTSRFALDPVRFPLLVTLGRNLSELAEQNALDPVIGRSREIEEVIDVLGKRRTNNPCLLGEPGVGKTAVVEGVAQRLLALSGSLAERTLVEIETSSLVAGTSLRGSFSERLNGLKDEVRRAEGRVVVFIDEIHTLVGAGATGEGAQDAANELKSAMARGEFPCIGATTHDEYRKFITQDPALERRFTSVVVNEPSVPETVEILQGVLPRYESHHGLTYTKAAIQAAASLSSKYITDRFLPDKAISLLDLAGSRCRREGKRVVEAEDMARVVSKLANIPESRLLTTDSSRLLALETELSERVVGHGEVIRRVAQVVRRNYAGFSSRRPMGSFLFLGPTGVGKTELARALAEVLFGSRDSLVRVDMSELSEAHAVSRLIGAPAGYVGYNEGGQLTEPVRRRPSSVVVLDEIEKAHPEVLMLLLQVLEEGRLTDGRGRHIDFSNAVVILTSNLGAEVFGRARPQLGFGASTERAPSSHDLEGAANAARRALPPELWNRVDEKLAFSPLSQAEVAQITQLLLRESSRRLTGERGIRYTAGEDVVAHLLASGGFDPQLGARPMRQTVQRLVEGPIAERILKGELCAGDQVLISVREGQLSFARA
jgi:ATP-dependent Clp protease ATP-binding subunit ClpC